MGTSRSIMQTAIAAVTLSAVALSGCVLPSPDEEACERWGAYVEDWKTGLDSDGSMRARARNVGREATDPAIVEAAVAVVNSPTRHKNGPGAASAVLSREIRILSEACAAL